MTDPTILLIFAVLGFWFSAALLVSLLVGVIRRHRRRKRTVELFAALCDAMDYTDAMDRHPAGRKLTPLGRPVVVIPCHCVLFCETGDRLDAEMMALTHVLECDIARSIRGEAA